NVRAKVRHRSGNEPRMVRTRVRNFYEYMCCPYSCFTFERTFILYTTTTSFLHH
ncbi:hypothetical protein ACN38_g8059, partial [Penicillium nordicum]